MWIGWKEVAWLVPWLGDSRSFRKGCSLQFQLFFQESYTGKEMHRPSSEDGGQRHQGSAVGCTSPTTGTDCSGFICWCVLLHTGKHCCVLLTMGSQMNISNLSYRNPTRSCWVSSLTGHGVCQLSWGITVHTSSALHPSLCCWFHRCWLSLVLLHWVKYRTCNLQ